MNATLSPRLRIAIIGFALLLPACADNGNVGPDDPAPVVSISGVQDGGSYTAPVTITIAVAPGSYSATLNGASFVSGGTVSQPGDYTLVVTGKNGLETRVEQVDFTIEAFGTGDVLIVRLFDLQGGTGGAPGDAILLTDSSSAGQFHALVDAGARNNTDPYVRDRLLQLDVDTLQLMLLTHAHADHFAGMDEILSSAIQVNQFVYNGQTRSLASYLAVIDVAEAQADTAYALTANRTMTLGGGTVATEITLISPLTTYLGDPTTDEMNDGSIGALVTHGAFRLFLTGDGEDEANARWQNEFATLSGDVDVLKVGHHGANNATQTWWLSHSSFETAVISANGTTHPRIAALANLRAISDEVYCTNVHGEIRITVDEGGEYTLQLGKNATADCVAGSQADT